MGTARPLWIIWLIASCSGIFGCNWITTADQLTIADDDESPADQSGGEDTEPTNSNGSGPGADPAGGGGGPSQPPDEGGQAPGEEPVGAPGVQLTDVVLYQAVSRPLMQGGTKVGGGTPVIADRDGLLRVFYNAGPGYDGQPITARLSIDGQPPIEQVVTLAGGSSEGNLQSTVNFDVPGSMMGTGASYRVDLLQLGPPADDNPAARYPSAVGVHESFGAQPTGKLTVTLVPVQYNGDGSGRMPDTGGAQLKAYADLFYGMYPVAAVDIKVRAAVAWSSTLASNGGGWSDLLNSIADLRAQDGAAFNNYYYGVFQPSSSLTQYCGGGCVAGLGFVGGPSDDWSHSAIGLGYSGAMATETAVHEIGHNHGREHAPCGVSGDPGYPYQGASIGVYGYDLLTKQLYAPSKYADMMSYCDPIWISDYNFTAIFNRIQYVNKADIYTPPELVGQTWQRLQVHRDGTLSWLAPIALQRPPAGESAKVVLDTVAGPEETTGQLIRYDHLTGGVLFVPPSKSKPASGKGIYALLGGVKLGLK